MSELDPVGRKDVRNNIFEEQARGRTVFFSIRILSDVELMCDQVTILRKGKSLLRGKPVRSFIAMRCTPICFWLEMQKRLQRLVNSLRMATASLLKSTTSISR